MPTYKGEDDFNPQNIFLFLKQIIGNKYFSDVFETLDYIEKWIKNPINLKDCNHYKVNIPDEIINKTYLLRNEFDFYRPDLPSLLKKSFNSELSKISRKINLSEDEQELLLKQIWILWGWQLLKRLNNFRVRKSKELIRLRKELENHLSLEIQKILDANLENSSSRESFLILNDLKKNIQKEIKSTIKLLENISKIDPISLQLNSFTKQGRPTSEPLIHFLIEVKNIIQLQNENYMNRLILLMKDLKILCPDLFEGVTINENNLRVLISKKINKKK